MFDLNRFYKDDRLVEVRYDDGNTLRTETFYLNGYLPMNMISGQRYIPAKSPLNGQVMLIIADYKHYMESVNDWVLKQSSVKREGMCLHFDTEADRTMFLLRFS